LPENHAPSNLKTWKHCCQTFWRISGIKLAEMKISFGYPFRDTIRTQNWTQNFQYFQTSTKLLFEHEGIFKATSKNKCESQ
jgi:hypothetical protein